MSAMHAVMDKLGVGMPCGFVARLQKKSAPEVEAAIETARQHFPLLQGRIAWRDSRAVLVATNHAQILPHTLGVSSAFESDPDGSLWRYRVIEDGEDTWLIAVWAHAVADGPSMLRFLETIGATIADAPIPQPQRRPRYRARRRNIVRWLAQFIYERYLPYLAPTKQTLHPPGVAWLTIPSGRSALLLKNAKLNAIVLRLARQRGLHSLCAQQGVRPAAIIEFADPAGQFGGRWRIWFRRGLAAHAGQAVPAQPCLCWRAASVADACHGRTRLARKFRAFSRWSRAPPRFARLYARVLPVR